MFIPILGHDDLPPEWMIFDDEIISILSQLRNIVGFREAKEKSFEIF